MNIEDIAFTVNPKQMTADHTNRTYFYITNFAQGGDGAVFKNEQKILVKNLPRLKVKNEAYTNDAVDATYFYIYFDYGENGTDLTTVNDGMHIEISPPTGWDVDKGILDSPEVYWILAPKATYRLGPKQNVCFSMTNIKCNKEHGLAAMYIIPVIEGVGQKLIRYQDIMKLAKPRINMFKPDKEDYVLGEPVRFVWNYDYASDNEVEFDGVRMPDKKESVVEKIEDRDYVLRVRNELGYTTEEVFKAKCLSIQSFVYEDTKEKNSILLKWDTKNAQKCEITTLGEVPPCGSREFPISKMLNKDPIIFTAGKGDAKCSRQLDFTPPDVVCKSFNFTKGTGGSINLRWETENAISCYISGHGNVGVKGSYNYVVKNKDPIILTAKRGVFVATKTLAYNPPELKFEWFKVVNDPNNYRQKIVSWKLINAEQCTLSFKNQSINQVVSNLASEGTYEMSVFQNTKYVLSAYILGTRIKAESSINLKLPHFGYIESTSTYSSSGQLTMATLRYSAIDTQYMKVRGKTITNPSKTNLMEGQIELTVNFGDTIEIILTGFDGLINDWSCYYAKPLFPRKPF